MGFTTQDSWEKFERWALRYEKKCRALIKTICKQDNQDFGSNELFLKERREVENNQSLGHLPEADLVNRILQKIGFLQAYLVDISFDGGEFMRNKSNFLTAQYPSKCDNSLGIWLERDVENLSEDNIFYHHFNGLSVNVFCKSITDVDLASMYNVLPYDRMFLRQPKGQNWDDVSVETLVNDVREDLEFDYSVEIKADYNENDSLLELSFNWNQGGSGLIEKSVSDLNFVHSKNPIPTVEIDIDSIPRDFNGYSAIVEAALQGVANNSPNLLATIYVYQGQSINFGSPTFSAFFGVAGQKKLLKLLLEAFQNVSGVNARYGDYINPDTAICEFHIQDGYVWRPDDATTWRAEYSNTEEESLEMDESDSTTTVEEDVKVRESYPARFRAARQDASIGTIRKTIEEVFGLPDGCVALCGPDGKKLRADATIGTLKKRWE